MKTNFCQRQNQFVRFRIPANKQHYYQMAICLVAMACCGVAAAQTNSPASQTNSPAAQTGSPPGDTSATNSVTLTNVTKLEDVTVIGNLDRARSSIMTETGSTAYGINKDQIQNVSQGDNAPFSQVILRAPGVAQDSAANGDLHVRGEHANLQYRINDVLLPEGISGFGLELDPRFVNSLQLITGSLPAEYGFRTAGVVDIQTKSGTFANGGEGEIYGGSHDTIRPSFELGGSEGKLNYFVDGSYEHNALGIENVTSNTQAIHDDTDQFKAFTYLSYILDDTSRVSVMGSVSYANFQIPIDPNQQPVSTQGDGNPWVPGTFTPTDLNDNQNEQNYYGVVAYQKSAGNFNLQVAGYGRESSAHYVPENSTATLFYNGGVASEEYRILRSGGFQADASYELGDKHTIRGGVMTLYESVSADTVTAVFPVDGAGNISGPQQNIDQENEPHALFAGGYLQDEWKILSGVTINYGARFDYYGSSSDNESQVSPRANIVWQPFDATTLHAGYSRYFTPPPLETVPGQNITEFNGTSGASAVTTADPVRAERANYYDVGITQKLLPGLQVGLDAYYKTAQNQLDDGLFGQSLILSSFNYTQGKVGGVEFTASYTKGGFSSYANVAVSDAQGKGAQSAQFLWPDQAVVNYVNNNWIYLDHDQTVTASFGAAYTFNETAACSTRTYVDALFGSGLRQDSTTTIDGTPNGDPIPNGASVPNYYTVNLGAEQTFHLNQSQALKARLDIVNVTDNSYELRSGTGVGVNAAQWGARLGIFGSISYVF
jgi:outer membrane receptor protein involved in Fe transport